MGDIYIGDINGIARKVKNIYVGDINGIARKVQKAYIGDANGIARQVYTAVQPYTPPTYTRSFYCGSRIPDGMLTARDMFSRSQLQAALDHGYRRIKVRIYWGSGQRISYSGYPELAIGIMYSDGYYYRSTGTSSIHDDYEYSYVSCSISSILNDPDFVYGPFCYTQRDTAYIEPGSTTATLTAYFSK